MTLRLLVIVGVICGSAKVVAEDLEKIFEEKTHERSQTSPTQVEALPNNPLIVAIKELIKRPSPDQSLFLRYVENNEWDKALLQYYPAFEGKPFQKSVQGRATFALAHIRAGLPVTGLELLFRIDNPAQIHGELRKALANALPAQHWSWGLAEIKWRSAFSAVFDKAVEARLEAVEVANLTDTKALAKKFSAHEVDSPARSHVGWQLVTRYGAENRVEEAAKILAQLMKSKFPAVGQDLMDLTAARLLFQNGHFAAAIKYYEKISRASDYWLDAQEEIAWAYVRKGEPENGLAVSKSLVIPGVAELARAEAFFVNSVAQLKICDYPGVIKTLEAFPKIFKGKSQALAKLSASSEDPAVKSAVQTMMAGRFSSADLGKVGTQLPRMITHDQRLLDYARAGRNLGLEANAADTVYSKSLALTGLQGYFDKLKQSTLLRAQKAVSAAQSRLKELARRENADIKAVLRKLHIVEAEVIQQISVADRVTEKTRGAVTAKQGTTGAKAQDTVQFPAEDEVWFDEIGNYRVNVKKACHAAPKGRAT